MPTIRTLYLSITFFCFQIPVVTKAQKLIQIDMDAFVQSVPQLPASLEELHRKFTIQTKYGEQFADAKIFNPVYEQVKKWITEIHDETINRKIKEHPRNEMSYKIQYDDERLRLTLRPLIGPQAVKKTAAFSTAAKDIVKQLVQLEKIFDWQNYYKRYDSLHQKLMQQLAEWDYKKRKLEDDIPMVQTEWGLQKDDKKEAAFIKKMSKEKMQMQDVLYRRHFATWTSFFRKYEKGIADLQQLLQQVNYGQHLPAGEQTILLPVMADVQARALESIERMIWQEMQLVIQGELAYNEFVIVTSMLK